MHDAMLIITQGSPLRYTEPFLSGIWDRVSRTTGFRAVEVGCSEREADCFAAVERLMEVGAGRVVIVPLILMDSQTEKRKIMNIFARLTVKYPQLSFSLSKAVTADVHIASLIAASAAVNGAAASGRLEEPFPLIV